METACLDNPQSLGQSGNERDDRIVEVFLEQRFDVKLEPSPFGEIARLLQKFGFELHRWLIDCAEDPLDRLYESCRGVFHPRREVDAASPGLVAPNGARAAEQRDKDESQ